MKLSEIIKQTEEEYSQIRDSLDISDSGYGTALRRYLPKLKALNDEDCLCSHCGDPIEVPLCKNCETQLLLPDEEY